MSQNHDNSKSCPPLPPTTPRDFYDDWQADGYEQSEYQPLAYGNYEPPTFDDFIPSPPAYLDNTPVPSFDGGHDSSPHHVPPTQSTNSSRPIYVDRWATLPPVSPVSYAPVTTPHYASSRSVTPVMASHAPPSEPEKPTMAEYLANVGKWPKWDGTPILPRPITTSERLKAMRSDTRMRIIEHRIRLKARQYAGNVLSFRQILNVILQGGCGCGKSTLVVGHKDPFVIIAPTTVIIRQLASDACQVIEAGVTPDFEKYTQFACTYDSLPRLCQAALEAGLDPYAIPLTVDECHHLLSDGYKGGRLNACMGEIRKFENVTFMSATPPPLIPYFENFSRIVLTRDPRLIKWSYAIGSGVAMAVRCLSQGYRVLLHINNKKKIQAVKEHFEGLGYRVEYIDSDNKDEMMERGLSDKRLPDADIYLCTSVFNDGISVHEHAQKYVVILSEESLRHLGPNEIVQVAQRLRDFVPHHVYLVRSSDEFDHDSPDFLWNDYINRYIAKVEQAEIMAATMTALYQTIKQTQSKETLMSWETHQSAWEGMLPTAADAFVIFNQEREVYEPNLRAIGEKVYSDLQKACYKSRHMMEYWLSLHDFEFNGIIKVEEETKLEKDFIKTSKNRTKAERKTQRDTITQFDSYQDALDASKVEVPTTYHEAAKELPFEEFAKGREGENEETLRQEHKTVLKERVKEAEVKRDAAKMYVSHVQTLCGDGVKFEKAVVQAKTDLANSTLTREALDILKHKSECQRLARDSRNPNIAKVDDIATVSEILEYMRGQLDKPLDKDATNAAISHALRHSQGPKGLRVRLTIAPRLPRNKPTSEAPTHELLNHALMLAKRLSRKRMTKAAIAEERERLSLLSDKELYEHIERADKEVRAKAIKEAAAEEWRTRKRFLNHFFKMQRAQRMVDGKKRNVWILTKELHLG